MSFLEELKRRRVFKVAAAYGIVAFVLIQVGDIIFPALHLPEWGMTLLIVLLIMGFPIVLILGWIYDITPQGVKKTEFMDGISSKLSLLKFLILAVVLVIIGSAGWFISQKNPGLSKTSKQSLAVMSFENLSEMQGVGRIGQIVQELIITDLTDIPLLKVFSSQRLFDVQKQLGNRDSRFIDPSLALEVARQAGAQNMLTGNVIDIGDRQILTYRLLDVDDGSVIKTRKAEGTNLYALIDNLTSLIRSDLEIENSESDVENIPLEQRTTTSLKAYEHYLSGVDYLNNFHFYEAVGELEQAVEIDSTFNKAYYKLAIAQWWNDASWEGKGAVQWLDKILNSPQKPPEFEMRMVKATKMLIQWEFQEARVAFEELVKEQPEDKELWYNLGEAYYHGETDNPLKALNAFEEAIRLDPEFKLGYKHIFDIYAREELYNLGIRKAKEYIESLPDETFGYLNLGKMYKYQSDFDNANEAYKKAYDIAPEDGPAIIAIADVFRREGKFEEAIDMAKSVWKLKEKVEDDIYFSAASIMVAAYLARGQYYKGLDICMRAPVLKIEKRNMGKFQMLMKIAILYDEISSLDSSYAYINKVAQSNPEPFFDVWSKFQLGQIYVSKKLPDSLKAVINDIEKTVDQRHQVFDIILPFISGLEVDHLMLTGKNKEALKLSKKLDNRAPLYLRDRYLKKEAMLLLKLKDYEEALEAGYLMQQQFVDPMNDAYNNPRSYYVLGRVYEEMGEINKARENYGKLLKLWKEAVNTIPELIDTKQRMEKLKQVQG